MQPGSEHVGWLHRQGFLEPDSGDPPGPIGEEFPEEETDWVWWPVNPDGFDSHGPEGWEPWLDQETVGEVMEGPVDDEPDRATRSGFDVCAWYDPMHFHGDAWGISVFSDCLIDMAKRIWLRLPYNHQRDAHTAHLVVWAAFDLLFQHEMFHHKIESLAIRLEIVTLRPLYVPYHQSVYRATFGTDDNLEEALANAHSYRWMRREGRRRLGAGVTSAAKAYMEHAMRSAPPGYRMGDQYVSNDDYKVAEGLLSTR